MDATLEAALSRELYDALRNRAPIPLISTRHPEFTVDDAYRISLGVHGLRLVDGQRETGKKIGLTAKAVQEMVGVNEPDYGILTDAMAASDGATLNIAESMITPMIEAEISLVLKSDLPLSGVTPEMVLEATDYVVASIEVVDSRFGTMHFGIVDTVADNASSAYYVLGQQKVDPRELNLPGLRCELFRNDEKISEGVGAAVLGSPLISVAWLANRLGSFGVSLNAGDVVLPGSVVPLAPVAPGDRFLARFEALGDVSLNFA